MRTGRLAALQPSTAPSALPATTALASTQAHRIETASGSVRSPALTQRVRRVFVTARRDAGSAGAASHSSTRLARGVAYSLAEGGAAGRDGIARAASGQSSAPARSAGIGQPRRHATAPRMGDQQRSARPPAWRPWSPTGGEHGEGTRDCPYTRRAVAGRRLSLRGAALRRGRNGPLHLPPHAPGALQCLQLRRHQS